jgi:hypothetical protein
MMRIIALLAVVAGAIWAAKTGKLKKGKLDDLRGRATGITDDLGKRAEEAADRVRSH